MSLINADTFLQNAADYETFTTTITWSFQGNQAALSDPGVFLAKLGNFVFGWIDTQTAAISAGASGDDRYITCLLSENIPSNFEPDQTTDVTLGSCQCVEISVNRAFLMLLKWDRSSNSFILTSEAQNDITNAEQIFDPGQDYQISNSIYFSWVTSSGLGDNVISQR